MQTCDTKLVRKILELNPNSPNARVLRESEIQNSQS